MLTMDDRRMSGPHVALAWADVPSALDAFLHQNPRTYLVEEHGQRVRVGGDGEAFVEFTRDFARWGRYAGVGGRVAKHNRRARVAGHFNRALEILDDGHDVEHLEAALEQVTMIYGLATSFGSKGLRMLRPDVVGVFDRLIAAAVGEPLTPRGFAEFSVTCQRAAEMLNASGTPHPCERVWQTSDVEAALFAVVRGWFVPPEPRRLAAE